MQTARLNKAILDFPHDHVARRFLEAFLDCQRNCIGRELPFPGRNDIPLDQAWFSNTDQRMHQFSAFAYEYLSFSLVLDGWLHDAREMTSTEKADLERLPHLQALMHECRQACDEGGNTEVATLVEQVQETLILWECCIRSRLP